jgi:hypothetical protein
MIRTLALMLALAAPALFAADVLFVADEVPAMEVVAKLFREKAGKTSEIVAQTAMPPSLASYRAVVVYIHRDILPEAEHAFLDYVQGGGRLMLLHHSISSGKRKNKDWLPALGTVLPTEKYEDGGYKYFDPVTFEVVNIAPDSLITSKDVRWDHKVEYNGASRDAFTAPDTEIYLNHRLIGERTPLLGVKWKDPKSGREFMQDTGGWSRKVGKGTVYYFMVGHNARDFEIPAYAQILTNALTAKEE